MRLPSRSRSLGSAYDGAQERRQKTEDARIVSAETEQSLGEALAERIRVAATERPLYKTFANDAPPLYWLWSTYRPVGEITEQLRMRFGAHGEEVDDFLGSYVGVAWGMETGLSRRADFRREAYNDVARVIDPDIVMAKLKDRYGTELDTPQYYHAEMAFPRRIAHQFAFIHQKVEAELAQPVRGTVAPRWWPARQEHRYALGGGGIDPIERQWLLALIGASPIRDAHSGESR